MDHWFGPLRHFLHLPDASCCPLPGLTPSPTHVQAEDANSPRTLRFAHALHPLTQVRIHVAMKFLKRCTEGDQPHTKHGGKAVTKQRWAELCCLPEAPTCNSPTTRYQRPRQSICLKKSKAL